MSGGYDDDLTRPLEGAPRRRRRGADEPGGRSRRVGRAARRRRAAAAARSATLEQRLARRPVVGVADAVRRPSSASCPVVSDSGYVRRVAFDTVVFMLLALGLNVVVGWGGLLDLGYVAFFGIGAYAYALLSSDQFDIHLPTLVVIPLVVVIGAHRRLPRRAAVAPADGRLPRDRDALLPPALPHVHEQRRRPLRPQRHRRARTGSSTSTRSASSGASCPDARNGLVRRRLPLRRARASSWSSTSRCASSIDSRTGRAWRSLREDPLAAELMGMPVNWLKLMASPSAPPSRRSRGPSSRR